MDEEAANSKAKIDCALRWRRSITLRLNASKEMRGDRAEDD